MANEEAWVTLLEIDQACSVPKGSAFRQFKRLCATLVENVDFQVLNANRDRERIAELRHARRIYGSSVNVVLVSAEISTRLGQALSATASARK